MKPISVSKTELLCPSAPPEKENSILFGVIDGTAENPHVTYLREKQPVTEKLIALSHPVAPTEIFRIATTCAANKCQNFDGKNCRLAKRIVQHLPPVEEEIPPCSIRSNCRWWQQEGKAACLRCPQIVTDDYNPSEKIQQVGSTFCKFPQ